MKPSVALIVLNWNNASDTVACLESLECVDACDIDMDRVIVVDNGSVDDSVAVIRQDYPGITLLQTGQNLGYAGGNNVGIRHALAQGVDYVGILNNDVTVAPGFLAPLLATLEEDARLGIATPLVAEMAEPDKVWALGSVVDRRTGLVDRLHAGERASARRVEGSFKVDIASGAAMLAKSPVFERVGLLDESFYLYYEEVDWCLKVREAGYEIAAVPASLVWHKVSATLGPSSPTIDYYMLRNHLRLVARHWCGAQRVSLLARIGLRNLMTVAAYTMKSHQGTRRRHRDARLLAIRDAVLGRYGKMGTDVAQVCSPRRL